MRLIIAFLLLAGTAAAQTIPNKANLVKVKGVTFAQVCNVLLDSGYVIEKKDAELQTAITEMREYKNSYNAAFKIRIRVKDSVATMTAYFTAPWSDPFTKNIAKTDRLWQDVQAFAVVDKKGNIKKNQLNIYPFMRLMGIAKALGGEVEYLREE